MTTSPLFRPEALAHLSRGGLVQPGGLIRLSHSWAPWAVAAAVAVLIGLGLVLIRGQYARGISLSGELVPQGGYLEVKAPASGWVSAWSVAQGQVVASGAELATVRSERAVAQGDVAELQDRALDRRRQALVQSLQVQSLQTIQRLAQLAQRRQSLQTEQQALQSDRLTLDERVALQEQAEQRDQRLVEQGFMAAAQLHARAEERLELRLRRGQFDRQLGILLREQQALEAEAAQLQSQQRRHELEFQAEAARLDQESAEWKARHALVLRAPQEGRVVMRARLEGQSVQAGQTLIGLVPAAATPSLQVVLWSPAQAVDLIQPGLTVWIRCAAFAAAHFGLLKGRVLEVSEVPMPAAPWPGTGESLSGLGLVSASAYRVVVELPEGHRSTLGSELALKAGMGVQADVRREPRALWQWWFEPLLARWRQWQGNPDVRFAGAPHGPPATGLDAWSDAI